LHSWHIKEKEVNIAFLEKRMHIKEIEVNIAFMERKNAYKRSRS